MMSTNFKLTTFFTKLLHNVNEPILRGVCKFQADIPISARVMAVHTLKIFIRLYNGSHVGGQKTNQQPIFRYNITKNPLTSLAHNSVFIGPNNFECCTEACCMIFWTISKFVVNLS